MNMQKSCSSVEGNSVTHAVESEDSDALSASAHINQTEKIGSIPTNIVTAGVEALCSNEIIIEIDDESAAGDRNTHEAGELQNKRDSDSQYSSFSNLTQSQGQVFEQVDLHKNSIQIMTRELDGIDSSKTTTLLQTTKHRAVEFSVDNILLFHEIRAKPAANRSKSSTSHSISSACTTSEDISEIEPEIRVIDECGGKTRKRTSVADGGEHFSIRDLRSFTRFAVQKMVS